MKLDMQKIYIDSRFRTADSKSESDFNVELPRSFNVPDGVVAHIDDIVIPVSWRTVDKRNNLCYVDFLGGTDSASHCLVLDSANYDGTTFAAALQAKLTTAIAGFTVVPIFACHYDTPGNTLTISIVDAREAPAKTLAPFFLYILTDAEVKARYKTEPTTINTTIKNTTPTIITETAPYTCFVDLFNTRNLYLTSSALCSYDTVSNFGMDTIIKKIPCTQGYNKMIFQSSGSTLDGLDVSKRTLRFLDFKLVDSSFRTIPLQGNHFSFSIVFVQKR
jgi:hypothetical protein